MRNIMLTSLLILFVIGCDQKNQASETEMDQEEHHDHANSEKSSEEDINSKKSIPKEVHSQIGDLHVSMHYYSPGVRNRMIYGGLVSFNEVWVTGAHRATNIELSTAIKINDVEIPAGKYGLFTIPKENGWAVILNKNWDQHLADDYDENEDVLRVDVEGKVGESNTERLTYSIEQTDTNSALLTFAWADRSFELPFKVVQK